MARHWAGAADVTVLAPASAGPRPEGAYRLVELPPVRGRVARLVVTARAAARLLASGGFDMAYVLHWRASGVAYRLAAAGRRPQPRYVQAVHDGEVFGLITGGGIGVHVARWLFRWTLAGAAWIVASGEYQVAMLERLGVARDRVFLSTYGVDAENFAAPAAERAATLRRRYRLGAARVLLTVARVVPHKGHDMVIRALPEILPRVPDAVYLIVGTGPHADALRTLAERIGVAEHVRFAGSVPAAELPALYHLSDIFVMATREEDDGNTEGFGIVFAEAAACGRPAIGGRTGGIVTAVLDGRTGLLVDPRSPAEIADAAIRLLTDRGLAARMGAAARRRVLDEMQYRDIAARVLDACASGERA
jgi:phosphatidylinositol alpha-1,6-mannosyltransferase